MNNPEMRWRILEILTEFEATKIRDSRIFLSEESIRLMVGDLGYLTQDDQFQNALRWLKGHGLVELCHKCGEPRWKTVRIVDVDQAESGTISAADVVL